MSQRNLDKWGTAGTTQKKSRPLSIPQQTMEFLMLITQPAALTHEASHSAFIRNAVLEELRVLIRTCDERGSY